MCDAAKGFAIRFTIAKVFVLEFLIDLDRNDKRLLLLKVSRDIRFIRDTPG